VQQTLVNGNRFSFVNLGITANGVDLPKGCVTAVNYKPQQQPGVVQGNLNVPTGRTQGYATCDGSIEILLSEANDFYQNLTGGDPTIGILDVDFQIIVQYSVNDIDIVTDTLLGCRLTDIGADNAQGPDATKRTHTLSIMRAFLNGIAAYVPPAGVQ
jgi:hypothetical protein